MYLKYQTIQDLSLKMSFICLDNVDCYCNDGSYINQNFSFNKAIHINGCVNHKQYKIEERGLNPNEIFLLDVHHLREKITACRIDSSTTERRWIIC